MGSICAKVVGISRVLESWEYGGEFSKFWTRNSFRNCYAATKTVTSSVLVVVITQKGTVIPMNSPFQLIQIDSISWIYTSCFQKCNPNRKYRRWWKEEKYCSIYYKRLVSYIAEEIKSQITVQGERMAWGEEMVTCQISRSPINELLLGVINIPMLLYFSL